MYSNVNGVGYLPAGEFFANGKQVLPGKCPELAEIANAAVLCNDAELHLRDGAWKMEGDPTEGALLAFAVKAGVAPTLAREAYSRTDAIPFESEHRFMATLNHDPQGEGSIYVKGAPERILEMCDQQASGRSQTMDVDYWLRCAFDFAASGLRLLAIAKKHANESQREVQFSDMHGGFTMLALVGIRKSVV